ncbi:hypothetical protein ABKN59_011644 [Abortiporus biennis]
MVVRRSFTRQSYYGMMLVTEESILNSLEDLIVHMRSLLLGSISKSSFDDSSLYEAVQKNPITIIVFCDNVMQHEHLVTWETLCITPSVHFSHKLSIHMINLWMGSRVNVQDVWDLKYVARNRSHASSTCNSIYLQDALQVGTLEPLDDLSRRHIIEDLVST